MFEDVRRTRSEALRLQAVASEARIVGHALREVVSMHFEMACQELEKAMRALRNSRRPLGAVSDTEEL
jgi:hypothetical protein